MILLFHWMITAEEFENAPAYCAIIPKLLPFAASMQNLNEYQAMSY
jgi:hypothetical protein